MKNPRRILILSELQSVPGNLLTSNAAQFHVDSLASLSKQGDTSSGADGEKQDDGFASVLKFLKFNRVQIANLSALKDTISALASTYNWIVTAITTVKAVLDFIGVKLEVFQPDKDPVQAKLNDIGVELDSIYGYLVGTVKTQQKEATQKWRDRVSQIRYRDLPNAVLSRSEININLLAGDIGELDGAIKDMLSSTYATIPFIRDTFKYTPTPATQIPTHWIDYATPFYMMNVQGNGVDYTKHSTRGELKSDPELQAQIWDPGYYLDVLIEAITLRISAATTAEPAFRSTGYDREELGEIYKLLGEFIKAWNNSIFFTRIIGPINPSPLDLGGGITAHYLSHPYAGAPGTCIPLGVVDPVSGISAFIPEFRDGFQTQFVPYPQSKAVSDSGGYWVLTNYDEAIATATRRQSQLFDQVFNNCGITILGDLYRQLEQLISPPIYSEFVDLGNVEYRSSGGVGAGIETVSLGQIGYFAGQPDREYKANRLHIYNTEKLFRIPMARRMDISRTQLGYKLGISFPDAEGEREFILTNYSQANSSITASQLPIFPSEPQSAILESTTAEIYDVYKSATFSLDDEEHFENQGSTLSLQTHVTPSVKDSKSLQTHVTPSVWSIPEKQILYLNPRQGTVKIAVNIDFEYDDKDPDVPFVGFAHVSISCPDPQVLSNFILRVNVYETIVGDQLTPQEQLADSMTLHFATDVLIVEDAYFQDRADGLKKMGQRMAQINSQYVHYSAQHSPIDPMSAVKRRAVEEQALVHSFAEFERHEPAQYNQLVERFQPRN